MKKVTTPFDLIRRDQMDNVLQNATITENPNRIIRSGTTTIYQSSIRICQSNILRFLQYAWSCMCLESFDRIECMFST